MSHESIDTYFQGKRMAAIQLAKNFNSLNIENFTDEYIKGYADASVFILDKVVEEMRAYYNLQ